MLVIGQTLWNLTKLPKARLCDRDSTTIDEVDIKASIVAAEETRVYKSQQPLFLLPVFLTSFLKEGKHHELKTTNLPIRKITQLGTTGERNNALTFWRALPQSGLAFHPKRKVTSSVPCLLSKHNDPTFVPSHLIGLSGSSWLVLWLATFWTTQIRKHTCALEGWVEKPPCNLAQPRPTFAFENRCSRSNSCEPSRLIWVMLTFRCSPDHHQPDGHQRSTAGQ